MAKRIVIAGSGGHGREIFAWMQSSPRYLSEVGATDFAFITDSLPEMPLPCNFEGRVEDYFPEEDDLVVCAIGDPFDRQKVAEFLAFRGAVFTSFVHDDALLGANVAIGAGVIIFPRVSLSTNISIGDHTHLNVASSVSHDCIVGSFVTVSPGARLLGGVTIEDGVFIGAGAVVLPRRKIGTKAVVGAQAAVNRDVLNGSVVAGVPARTLRSGTA